MCAIFGIFFVKGDYINVRKSVVRMVKRLLNRGPDATGIKHFTSGDNVHHFLAHQRLSIVDPFGGDQPFYGQYKKTCSVTNGEIFNHMELRKKLTKDHKYISHSDCEVIPHMFDEIDDFAQIVNLLHDMFGVVLFDFENQRVLVARDHLGIIPVYIGRGKGGEFYVASEMKAFHDYASSIEILLPGSYYKIIFFLFILFFFVNFLKFFHILSIFLIVYFFEFFSNFNFFRTFLRFKNRKTSKMV